MSKWQVKECKREGCGVRVYAIGLCSQHYHEFIFPDESAILDEWEDMCWNPTCGAPIVQNRDERGLIVGKVRMYCAPCKNFLNRNNIARDTSWRDASEDAVQECPQCLTVYSHTYMNSRSICEFCSADNRREAVRRQTEKKRLKRAAARAQKEGA